MFFRRKFYRFFFLEGRSWRKDIYAPYKRQRTEARAAQSPREAEEDRVFWETFDEFKGFITEKTNTTVLQHPRLEADDLIAGWIQSHPEDTHIIVSTDGDFAQLIVLPLAFHFFLLYFYCLNCMLLC